MITSQLPVEAWHEVIGEPTCAIALNSIGKRELVAFLLQAPIGLGAVVSTFRAYRAVPEKRPFHLSWSHRD